MNESKQIKKWIWEHPGIVEAYHVEYDGGSDHPSTDWSHWLYLESGYRNPWLDPCGAVHLIHECTVEEVMDQLRDVEPCSCEECREDALCG